MVQPTCFGGCSFCSSIHCLSALRVIEFKVLFRTYIFSDAGSVVSAIKGKTWGVNLFAQLSKRFRILSSFVIELPKFVSSFMQEVRKTVDNDLF